MKAVANSDAEDDQISFGDDHNINQTPHEVSQMKCVTP